MREHAFYHRLAYSEEWSSDRLYVLASYSLLRWNYEAVPGCSGHAKFKSVDFCAVRATPNTLWSMGNGGRPKRAFPLGLCEGDCDSDLECESGLTW